MIENKIKTKRSKKNCLSIPSIQFVKSATPSSLLPLPLPYTPILSSTTMKLFPSLLTKILATTIAVLVVPATAAEYEPLAVCPDGSGVQAGETIPEYLQVLETQSSGQTTVLSNAYCTLPDDGLDLYVKIVQSAIANDSFAFLETCLFDFAAALQYAQAVASGNACTDGNAFLRRECAEGTEIGFIATLSNATHSTYMDLNVPMCVKPVCDQTVLQEVVRDVFFDILSPAARDTYWINNNYTVDRTYTPTAQCNYEQFGKAVRDPNLFCTDASAANNCNTVKLVDVEIGPYNFDGTTSDEPRIAAFAVAFCDDGADDGSCMDSMPAGLARVHSLPGPASDPYCLLGKLMTSYNITGELSSKTYDEGKYCSRKTARSRTGLPCVNAKKGRKFKVEGVNQEKYCWWYAKKRKCSSKIADEDRRVWSSCARSCGQYPPCVNAKKGEKFKVEGVKKEKHCGWYAKKRKCSSKIADRDGGGRVFSACAKSCRMC